ncbi:MAG: hypothetical protein AMXMBFR58_26380 [Phycisphaerae bacterium]|nr:hypothetical protein [Phycisphaerales bacterium]MCK6477057.1 hypothetical protein [Phycisphaerales bacterium]
MTTVSWNTAHQGLGESAGPLITPDLLAPPPRKPSIRQRLNARWNARVRDPIRAAWKDPLRRPKMVRNLRIAAAVLVVAAGAGVYYLVRPVPQPDYLDAGMDDILDYTLLTEEFNKLPLKERLALVGQLVSRLKNMDSGDSALMAAFAAGIAGQAREQLMANVSHLAIDVWDSYAARYDGVTAENRDQFLEEAFLDFTKTMESVAGVQRNVSDADRLNQARRDAARDTEALRTGRGPPSEALGRMFTFMRDGVGSHATPQQRARGAVLMRDMMRHFRGEGSPR